MYRTAMWKSRKLECESWLVEILDLQHGFFDLQHASGFFATLRDLQKSSTQPLKSHGFGVLRLSTIHLSCLQNIDSGNLLPLDWKDPTFESSMDQYCPTRPSEKSRRVHDFGQTKWLLVSWFLNINALKNKRDAQRKRILSQICVCVLPQISVCVGCQLHSGQAPTGLFFGANFRGFSIFLWDRAYEFRSDVSLQFLPFSRSDALTHLFQLLERSDIRVRRPNFRMRIEHGTFKSHLEKRRLRWPKRRLSWD